MRDEGRGRLRRAWADAQNGWACRWQREREGPLGGGQLWPVAAYAGRGGRAVRACGPAGRRRVLNPVWALMGLVARMTRVEAGGRPKACSPGASDGLLPGELGRMEPRGALSQEHHGTQQLAPCAGVDTCWFLPKSLI